MTKVMTFTGRQFDVAEPDSREVRLLDIAHALSNICRFGGHTREFYSVAEHSVHVSYSVPEEHAFAALMHDAGEAYLIDMPSPVKQAIPGYAEVEERVRRVVFYAFGIDGAVPEIVHRADKAVLEAEIAQLMYPGWERGVRPMPLTLYKWTPAAAKMEFLSRFHELQKGR
jgi:uncharacterized protein